jgi:hypothetical protein
VARMDPIRVPIELEMDGVPLGERLTAIEDGLAEVMTQLTQLIGLVVARSERTPETGPR